MDVTWWPFIYFYSYFWGSLCIQKPWNSIQRVSIAKVSLCDFFLSIHIMWELTRYGLQEKNRTIDSFILFYVNWKCKGLATIFGHSRSITAALRGGKLETAALPPLPSAVKSIFQLSSAPSGGKLEIAFTLLLHVAESFQSDSLSFFPFLCSSVGHGSGLSSTKWRMDMCE